MMAALFVSGEIVLGTIRIISTVAAPSGTMMIIALALCGGSILLLCRVPMPIQIRATLIIGLIVILLAMGAKSNLLVLRGANGEVTTALNHSMSSDGGQADAGVVESIPDVVPPPLRGGGARVALESGPDGDGGWAHRINLMADRSLGGPRAAALSILGTITLTSEPGFDRLTLVWSISDGAGRMPCGTMTIMSAAGQASIDQIVASLRKAVEHSAEDGSTSCF